MGKPNTSQHEDNGILPRGMRFLPLPWLCDYDMEIAVKVIAAYEEIMQERRRDKPWVDAWPDETPEIEESTHG